MKKTQAKLCCPVNGYVIAGASLALLFAVALLKARVR
jgi:hypothetical protein